MSDRVQTTRGSGVAPVATSIAMGSQAAVAHAGRMAALHVEAAVRAIQLIVRVVAKCIDKCVYLMWCSVQAPGITFPVSRSLKKQADDL